MRLAIEHTTHYRFTEPQARLVQLLRLTPRDDANQTIVNWRIDVSCDARLRHGMDGYGNAITMLYAEGPLDEIAITVSGEVLTSDGNGVIDGISETMAPTVYRRLTPTTRPDDAIRGFADRIAHDHVDRLPLLWALTHALPGHWTSCAAKTERTEAAEMFAADTASPRDMALVFVSAARALSIPARYVVGYSLAAADAHGAPGPHGWAEAWVDGLGWVGFDPSQGHSPDEGYVRIAVGLDAAGSTPIAGMRIGHGQEVLDVDVHVDRLGGEG
jgi:transglutaminase-like putative cysteine protease